MGIGSTINNGLCFCPNYNKEQDSGKYVFHNDYLSWHITNITFRNKIKTIIVLLIQNTNAIWIAGWVVI